MWAVLGVAGAALAGACTKVDTDPNAVVAIVFDQLPFPAVVAGDTMRDEAGQPVSLSATALNADGEAIADAPVIFLSLDAAGVVSPEHFVIANVGTATQMRVVAEALGLQSRPLTVVITPKPDSMAQQGTVDTLDYLVQDDPTQNISQAFSVKVLNTDAEPPVPARGWVVNFSVEYHGELEPVATSTRLWLVDETNRRSDKDTTDAQGVVSRRLRLSPSLGFPPDPTLTDSVVVIASATYRGVPLTGSPVRTTVYLKSR